MVCQLVTAKDPSTMAQAFVGSTSHGPVVESLDTAAARRAGDTFDVTLTRICTMTAERVKWQCPSCGRRFTVRGDRIPNVCPDCRPDAPTFADKPPSHSEERSGPHELKDFIPLEQHRKAADRSKVLLTSSLIMLIGGAMTLFVVGALVATGVYFYSSHSKSAGSLLGAWTEVGGTETVEFFEDGER